MDMRKLMMQAQAMQGKLEKFKKEEFTFLSTDKLIEIVMTGDREIILLNVEKLLQELEDDHEMINDMLKIALNDALKTIDKKEKAIAGNLK
ncbi:MULTISPECIES: YbaB/EbfC family nucleoid-associated protein [unclassified Spiroplasma]|uniref:YbaB/EbfC family nucleoid-associated protein n=1 Tax=unclassified Spiroplasma TaxID=2637901 RepID=UPI0027E1902C|nr:YbaB/EbfC family nucleoid-associated protein [Spiroplasma sp. AdecLV25b]